MRISIYACLFAAACTLAGCTTQQEYLQQIQPTAIETAERRGRFELECPDATATVLSSKVLELPFGPFGGGGDRAEYTIGVSGCGRRTVYMAICTAPGNCNAQDNSRRELFMR